MKKWVLRLRKSDIPIYEALVSGEKSIETRAGTVRYQKIEKGDILVMSCGKDHQEFSVGMIDHFPSVKDLFDAIDYRLILPESYSRIAAENVYKSFSGYDEKIKQFGILAFHLLPVKQVL